MSRSFSVSSISPRLRALKLTADAVREKKISTREYLDIGRKAKAVCDKVR